MRIRVRTLGGLDVLVDGTEVGGFGARRLCAALLVYLALERAATRDEVITLLWPERTGRRGRHSLSQLLYEMKADLGDGWLRAQGDQLRTDDRVEADALHFTAAVEKGGFQEAFRLYRGPFLQGVYLRDTVEFEQWTDRWRGRLRAVYREACRAGVSWSRSRGNRAAAVMVARRWTEDDPHDARARRVLLELLIEADDRQGALREYERYERRLLSAGMSPASEVTAVIEDVRRETEAHVETVQVPELPSPSRRATGVDIPRLVVLPFEHLGDARDELFTEGVTDEITSRLVQVSGLAVIARTSANRYRETTKGVDRIRRELGVDFVLEGTVRLDGSTGERRVRVTPQLIRAEDATHLWAETYEATLDEVFGLQSRIAERVAEVLDVRLRARERRSLQRPVPRDPDVHELCVRGMRRWEESTDDALRRAVELFRRAVELEPDYARAWAGLALAYAFIPAFAVTAASGWVAKARLAANRALELDPSSPEAHMAMGKVAYLRPWELDAAERHLCRALELASSSATTHVFLAYVQLATGQRSEAFETMARAHALDPLSVATNFHVGFHGWQGHDRDLAVRQFRLVNQLAPGFGPSSYVLGAIHYREEDGEAARREWASISLLGPAWEKFLELLDEPEEAVHLVDRFVELAPEAVHWYYFATLYALLDAPDRALRVLVSHERNLRGDPATLPTTGPGLGFVATDPLFGPLRGDPRYGKLIDRIGLG